MSDEVLPVRYISCCLMVLVIASAWQGVAHAQDVSDVCADPRFLAVPAGDFIAGSDRPERDLGYAVSGRGAATSKADVARVTARLREQRWFEWEEARGTESLDVTCLQRRPVTNAEYLTFVQDTGHRVPFISKADYQTQGFLHHPYSRVEGYLWRDGQPPTGERDHPVVLVSYADISAYARWLGERDGARYRLPTRQEWEKAARGSDGRYFPWGNTWRDDATNWSKRGYHSVAVGTYNASRGPYGHEDMAGNVFEWTSTLRHRDDGTTRAVLKGCSWDDLPGFCRGAYHHTRPIGSRHILFGFRLVKVPA